MKRANVGSGAVPVEAWDCYDVLGGGRGPVTHWDVRARLRSHRDHYDYAVAHHMLTALDHHELPGALGNIRAILKPGGVLRISVSDLMAGIDAWEREDAGWFPQDDHIDSVAARFCTWVTWFGTHRSVFTPQYLNELLEDAGFAPRTVSYRVTRSDHPDIVALDSRPGESLWVEAFK